MTMRFVKITFVKPGMYKFEESNTVTYCSEKQIVNYLIKNGCGCNLIINAPADVQKIFERAIENSLKLYHTKKQIYP